MDKKTILVTGGAGFIGSNLCKALQSAGHDVTSLDDYSSGSYANHVDGVTYVKGDTNNIFTALRNSKFDLIYHLGEFSRVEASFEHLDDVFWSNSSGTFEVLKYVKATGGKLIYAGSSTKFGHDQFGADSSPYAFTKSTNTQLVKNFADWYGIDYAITYFYNVYGTNEIKDGKYATLIAKFLNLYRQGEPLPVVSPGTQQRNFTHVDDIVAGLLLVGEHGHGDGFGIGSPEAYTVLEIAEMFDTEIVMLPERKGNRLSASLITHRTEELGWSAKKNIKDYIKGELI